MGVVVGDVMVGCRGCCCWCYDGLSWVLLLVRLWWVVVGVVVGEVMVGCRGCCCW